MSAKGLSPRQQALIACVLLALALTTNRWMGWSDGIAYLSASDVEDGYLPVALASPSLPAIPVPFHKAQRLFVPYVVGLISHATGATVQEVFMAGLALTQLMALILFWRLLQLVPPRRRLLAFGLFVFQPYALRYYWIVPGMLADVVFLLGALLAITGLQARKAPVVFLGFTLAILGRQTALLLLPGAILWLSFGTAWRDFPRLRRASLTVGLCVCTLFLYSVTGNLAARFGTASQNGEHLTGLLFWIFSSDFSARALFEHTLRCTLPLLSVAALFLAARSTGRPREAWFLGLMCAAVMAQPFMAGPLTTGQNAARLVTLGLPMLILAWVKAVPSEWASSWRFYCLGTLLFAGSFHHLYTITGPSTAIGTAALQIAVAVGAFALARRAEGAPH